MTPLLLLQRAVIPGLSLLPAYMDSRAARVMLVAIAGQESGYLARAQTGGPARGYWQFELGGATGVMTSAATRSLAGWILQTCDVPSDQALAAIEFHDALAAAFARLLLWSDPAPIPLPGDQAGAWEYYERNWRPGKPDVSRWAGNYAAAMAVCG